MTTKNDIFKEKLKEYLGKSKPEKGLVLDAVCAVTGMVRKSAIRRFRKIQMTTLRDQETRGRPVMYTPDVVAALRSVWDVSHEPCGENLHPMMREYVGSLMKCEQWDHDDIATGKLCAMSLGTVKRLVSSFERVQHRVYGRGTTKPSAIHTEIPIRMDGWDVAPPGTFQLDTVAHCGHTVAGDFVYTVNMTDVATLWGCRRCQWNKGQEATCLSIDAMIQESPVNVVELHPDSGGEFVNWHCIAYCKEHGIDLTRSRPYHKNDNCFVEERNGHVVRSYVGYARLDSKDIVEALNLLYDVLTPYLNHFIASRRILKKERIGARWKVTRESVAQTPYQRVLAHPDIDEKVKEILRREHASLDMVWLRDQIDERLKRVFTIQQQHEKTRKLDL